MATGVGFSFDTSFLKNLEKADAKMASLMDKSNQASRSIVSAFQQMNNQGVVPFVQSLEKQKQTLDSVFDAITTKTGKARKGYEGMASSVVDATNALVSLISKMKSTSQYQLDTKLSGLSAQIKELQEYQERQRQVKAASEQAMNAELDKYRQLIERVRELNSIKAQAKEVKTISTDKELVKDANKAQREANAELRILKEQQKQIEQKYAIETALIRKQADAQSFKDKASQAAAATKAVEAEIKKEQDAYLKSLSEKIRARQEQLQREQEVARQRAKIAKDAEAAVEAEIKKEQDAYLKSLSEKIRAQQEYAQRMKELEQARLRQQSANRRAEYNLAMAGEGNLRTKNGIASSADNAIRYTNRLYSEKGLRNINNMNLAIQKMQQAQQRLNLNTEQGRQKYEQLDKEIKRVKGDIDRVTGASENLNKSHKGLLDTSGQLARAMAAVFSVSAIKGYVNKLMQIRGEFELQQRSLQVLLQNKDEANALWDKTVSLAVKSPYTTQQLVTATKQLAAYRIESEKLYETNRMLADVSIGLGVDMNRLILAFGQVKAANFLRGTELRQFSEAGVNMLDELAKRFTALEGRAVSVGEVFERVSKRMVSFADVEAVFKTITSEGGVFYKMQEKQSETLKGMMLNLKDSYELMLNDVGKSNEGMLKGFVSFMKIFVDGWREAAVVIKTAGTAMLFYFAASKIAKIGSAFSGLWAAMAANPVGAIAAGVGVLIGLFVSLYQHTNKLNEALLEVEKNVTESLEESIGLYHELTDTINDSTKSLDERNKAYEELKAKFKDILPDQLTELNYIESLAFNYKAAEDAMFSYYNAKAIAQKKDKVESIYESDFDRDTKDIIKQIKENIDDIDKLSDEQKTKMKAGVSSAVFRAVEELKKGTISDKSLTNYGFAAVAENFVRKIEHHLKTFSGDVISLHDANVHKNAKELTKTAKEYRNAMSDVSGLAYQTFAQKEATEAMAKHSKDMETAVSLYKHLVSLRQKIADNKIDLTTPDEKLNEEQLSKREWYLNSIQNIYSALAKDVPQYADKIKELDNTLLDSANKGAYEYKLALGGIENELFNVFAENAKSLSSGDDGAQAMLTNFAENIKATADSKLATPLMEAITSAFNKAINDKDLSQKGKDLLAKLLPDEKQSTGDVRKMVEALLKQYQDEVKKWENATNAGATSLPLVEYLNQFGDKKFKSAMGMYLGSDEEFNELQQKVIPVLEHIDRLLGGDPNKDKKGGSRDLVDERLRVIKEIYKAYKELNKTFDETTSKTGAMEKFGDAFYSAFGKNPEEMGYNLFTAEGVVDAYKKFISTLSKADDITKGNLAKGEFVMELQVEMQQQKDKAFQDQIEQMFSGYELSLELEKLNIPRDVAERLFGVDTFDLSEIRQKLEGEMYNLQSTGGRQDQIDALQKYLDKVVDMEQKQQKEMLKNYSKYLIKAQSERVRIKLDEVRQIQEIESLAISDIDKEIMKKGVQAETQKKLDSQAWKDFQDSGAYVRLFDDLEMASYSALSRMEEKLLSLRESLKELDPSELKEINNQLEKLRELKVEKNPFREMGEDAKTFFEYLKNRKEWEANLAASERQEETLKTKKDDAQLNIDALEKQLATTEKLHGAESKEANAIRLKLQRNKANLDVLLNQLVAQEKITKEEADKLKKGTDAGKSLDLKFSNIASGVSGIVSATGEMATNLEEAFGMSTGLKETFEVIQGVGGGIADMFSGAADIMSGNPFQMIQGAMQMVTGVSKIVSTFNKLHDDKLERKIQREIKLVETLQKQYEKLAKVVDTAYSVGTFQAANEDAKANLEAQIAATERMIEAEEAKKDTDHKRIEEFREQVEEYNESLKELEATRLQELGGVGGEEYYKDVAQSFVDTWLDAYLEVGDGMDALEEQFDDLLMNIAKKQLMLRATDKFLAPLYRAIDEAVADTQVTREEMQGIEDKAQEVLPQLNEFLKQLFEEMGMTESLGGKSTLGGLQAGIQSVSEETANILAAYLNSCRYFLSTIDTNVKTITDSINIANDVENPIVGQLRIIASQTTAINDLLNSLTAPHPTQTGRGLKVII